MGWGDCCNGEDAPTPDGPATDDDVADVDVDPEAVPLLGEDCVNTTASSLSLSLEKVPLIPAKMAFKSIDARRLVIFFRACSMLLEVGEAFSRPTFGDDDDESCCCWR